MSVIELQCISEHQFCLAGYPEDARSFDINHMFSGSSS